MDNHMDERKHYSISELADALHLPELESAWKDEKIQLLASTLSDRFNIHYEPMMLPCTDWKTPGWPQTLKKAFEIAAREKDSSSQPVELFYREETPGAFILDGTGLTSDRNMRQTLQDDADPVIQTIIRIALENSPFR